MSATILHAPAPLPAPARPVAPAFDLSRLPPRPPVGRVALDGLAAVTLFLGAFGWWAATAPLDSAAVADGSVIVESRRKTVQHLEGGIVAEIRAAEGMRVAPGDLLVRLDDTQARSQAEALRVEQDELAAQEARLIAERDAAPAIAFPEALLARQAEPRTAALLAGQRRIFAARADSLQGQTDILEQRQTQLDAEIAGLRAQVAGAEAQLRLIAEEAAGVEALVRDGLERRPRLLALQRQAAGLEGSRGEYLARIAQAEQRRGEAELQIYDLRNRRAEQVAGELREVQARLAERREALRSAEDVLRRTAVTAPTGGVVMDLRIHTPGGVIGAGQPILDIVPAEESLLVEARLRLIDIESVRAGLPAQVRLLAFKQRTTPVLTGTVVHVAADSLTDQRTGQTYYTAQVAIPTEELARLGSRELHPGMPALVMILTGERTALDYLLTPVQESFARAFREK